MNTREEIYQKLREYLIELFEVPEDTITLESHLINDLDLDSIDAVDLIVKVQQVTGRKMPASDFKSVRTVSDVVEKIYAVVNDKSPA
jgi:acyl carrier protein